MSSQDELFAMVFEASLRAEPPSECPSWICRRLLAWRRETHGGREVCVGVGPLPKPDDALASEMVVSGRYGGSGPFAFYVFACIHDGTRTACATDYALPRPYLSAPVLSEARFRAVVALKQREAVRFVLSPSAKWHDEPTSSHVSLDLR